MLVLLLHLLASPTSGWGKVGHTYHVLKQMKVSVFNKILNTLDKILKVGARHLK